MNERPSLIPARDGLLARNSGPWALEKLGALDAFAGMVTTAMKGKFSEGLVFVDLMAGPGRCIDTRTAGEPEFDGSTLRALDMKYPFSRVVAVESSPDCFEALRTRVGTHERASLCTIIHDDCNEAQVIARLRQLTRGALTLMFVDLLGTEVEMSTLRSLTAGRSIDLVITWPEMDAVRNQGLMLEQKGRWNRFLGTEAWQHLVTTLGPARRLRSLQKLYQEQLRSFGYLHSEFSGSVRNNRGHALYRPLFATRHPLGTKFWRIASKRSPQLGLFE